MLLAAGGLAGVLVGSTLDAGAGTALMVASSVLPPAVLGTALVRTGNALERETRHRHRLAGQVAVSDEQLSRLGGRVEDLADRAQDQAAEAERTRAGLRHARVELATARAALAGVREQTVRARSSAEAAVAARDEARQVANAALARADAATAAARRAEAALARAEDTRAEDTRTDGTGQWRAPARVEGQRSFASVDLRIFDAFVEADMADEHAVLDAPARRGRHSAVPSVDVSTADAQAGAAAARTADRSAATAGTPRRGAVRDVA